MVREVRPFGQVTDLPPWLDGPVIKALAKRNHWTYAQAQDALAQLGHMPSNVKVEADDRED